MPPKDQTQMIYPHQSCALHTAQLEKVADKIDDIHRRLFVDNGEPCLQSKVRRCTDVTNGLVWALGVVVIAVVGVLVEMFKRKISP
jgi:hypothetical protein